VRGATRTVGAMRQQVRHRGRSRALPNHELRWRDRSDFAWWLRWLLARWRAHRRG
jgi:hypothetical protein